MPVLRGLASAYPHVRTVLLEPDDIVLLCSAAIPDDLVDPALDGMHDDRRRSARQLSQRLITDARRHGVRDTLTSVVVCPSRVDLPPPGVLAGPGWQPHAASRPGANGR
jgi:hypothetical protein